MFTTHTYQDWQATNELERPEYLVRIIKDYKASADFKAAREGDRYFNATETEVSRKKVARLRNVPRKTADGKAKSVIAKHDIVGNQVASNFLFRFVTQENQFLLGNGVTLDNAELKARLGPGFDTKLQQAGEKALVHGCCWGLWNMDHLELLKAADGNLSGFVALLDERTSAPMVGIHFWQISARRPMYIRLFEADGITEYTQDQDEIRETAPKRAYKQTIARDVAGEQLVGSDNYGGVLPIIPLYASEDGRGVLTPDIKSKIDAYDCILSDFADNLDRANDVYWVLNNFGGTQEDIIATLAAIQEIKAVANISDGTGGGSTAEPHTIEVPYQARRNALELLEKALYADAMAMNMDEISGGSLTNVAIETAATNLNLKCDRFEWQIFAFVQGLLKLIGVESEEISFKRRVIANKSEMIADIQAMRQDIDHETALKLNPYITQEEIPQIMENVAAERMTGAPSVEELERLLKEQNNG